MLLRMTQCLMDWLLLTPGEPSGCKREHGTTRHKSHGDTAHGARWPSGSEQPLLGLNSGVFTPDNPMGNSCEQQLRALQLNPPPRLAVTLPQLPLCGCWGCARFRNPTDSPSCPCWALCSRRLDAVVSFGKVSAMVRCGLEGK